MKFPLAVIDFEASSLSLESYPIEVGVAIALDAQGPIDVWSTLICPSAEWLARSDWDEESAMTHGISRSELEGAAEPFDVANSLNMKLASIGLAWCDGGQYDGHWLRTLYQAAGLKPSYALWDIAAMFIMDRRKHNRFAEILAKTEAPHRAGSDAFRLCEALVSLS